MLCKFWKNCQLGDKCPWSHDRAPTNYKTTLCNWLWRQGTCSLGDKCISSHDLRSNEAEICRFFMPKLMKNGMCRFGERCNYAHSIQELRFVGQVASEETVDSSSTYERSSIGREEPAAAYQIKREQSQKSIGNRGEYLSGESIKKRKRSISSSNEEVSVIERSESSDQTERRAGSNANLKLGNEANNNQSKDTEDIQDLEGEKVVARVKARLARMEEKAKVGDGDEALTLKIQLVREKLKRYDFLMNMKREIERKSLRQSYEPLKKRDGTPKSSFGSETSSDDESSSGSDEDASMTMVLAPQRMRKLVRGWSWRDVKAVVEEKTGAVVERVTGTAPQQIRLTGSSKAILRAEERIEDYIRDA